MGVKCSKQPKLMPIILEEDEIELSSVSPLTILMILGL